MRCLILLHTSWHWMLVFQSSVGFSNLYLLAFDQNFVLLISLMKKNVFPKYGDDDDDNDDDDELVLLYGWLKRGTLTYYFQPRPLSEILTTANLWHSASRVWTCPEPEFKLSWMKLCSSDNNYSTVPQSSVVPQHHSIMIGYILLCMMCWFWAFSCWYIQIVMVGIFKITFVLNVYYSRGNSVGLSLHFL